MIPPKNLFSGALTVLFSSRKFSRRTRTARRRLAALRTVTARQRFGLASRAALLSGALLLGSRAASFGQGAIPGDTQYTYNFTTNPGFTAGFTPTFTSDANGQLNFGGTAAYTAADDLAASSANNLTFTDTALVTISAAAVSTNVLTLTNNSLGIAPSIYVGSGGATINTILAGTAGFVKNGAGTLTLQTNADTFTGAVTINAGTLALNIGQAATATFGLNNGATLTTTQGLAAGNVISALTGTSTFTSSAVTNTVLGGNGNLLFSVANSTAINQAFFAGFGGTAIFGNNNGFRVIASSSGTTTQNNPFATLDFAATTGNIYSRGGASAIFTFGGIESSGNGVGLSGNSNAATETFIIGSANTSTTYAGRVNQGAGNTVFIKVGTGTLTLTDTAAATSFTALGGTSLNGGTLTLDYTTNNAGILAATGAVNFGGGSLNLLGKTGAFTTTQTVGAVTATGAGGASLIVNPNGGTSTTLTMGALVATAAGATLNIQPSNVTLGTGTATITTTTNKLADGTYGARITYGSDWATTASTATPFTLSAYAGYTPFTGSGDTATTNYLLAGSGTVAAGGDTVNSLKITTGTTGQTLDLGGNTLTLTNGGLLFAGANDYTVGVTAGSTLKSNTATNSDLIIQQLGTGNLTVNAVIANGIGASTLTKAGFGTLTLGGVNTYTGSTFLNGGIASISAASGLGAPAAASAIFLNGGTLQATGTFSLAGGTTGGVSILGGGGTFDVTGANNLTLTSVVANSAANNFGPLIKTNTGTLTLTGTNTYGGATIIRGGILSVGLLANGGVNSGIGASLNAAPALILDGGTLQYTGPAVSTDRTFTLTQNGGTLDASGSGALALTSVTPNAYSGTGARTLTFTGTNTGNNTFANTISDASATTGTAADGGVAAASGVVSVAKSGAGKWVLGGINTYTGNTTISLGTLALAGATTNSIANSPVITVGTTGTGGAAAVLDVTGLTGGGLTIGTGRTLAGTGTVTNTGAVVIGSGGILSPGYNNSVATLSLGALTLNNGSITNFGLGTGSNNNALVASSGLLTLNATDGINLFQVGTTTKFTTPGTYTLFTYGTLSGTPSSAFTVLNPAQGETYAFALNGNSIQLTISGAAAVTSFWNVDANGNYSVAGNWSNGVPTGAGATAVFGPVITAPRTVTVDGTFTLGEIDFNNANAYTLNPAVAGNGFIFDNSGAAAVISDANGSHTVATPIALALGLNVGVTNAADKLTLSGVISNTGAAGTGTLTKSGAGTLALLGANTFDGGMTITNGTVQINSAASLGAVTGTATLDSSTNAVTLEALNSITTTRNFALNSTNNNIQVDGTATYEIDGVIAVGTTMAGTLTKTGTGTLTLGNNETFGGIVTVSAGTLSLGAGGTAGSVSGNIIDNGAVVLNRTDNYTLGNQISGTGTLAQTGGGTTTLTAVNTFTGGTTIGAGTLVLGNALALQGSTLNYDNQGGTLSFGTLTAATLGGLSGGQNLALTNAAATPAAVTLTVGGNNSTSTYSGSLSGGGSLVKTGSGTLTFSGADSYTGSTTVNGGALTLTGSLGSATTRTGAVFLTGSLNINGGSVYGTSLTIPNSPGFVGLSGGGTLNLTGTLAVTTNGSASSGLASLGSGTVSVNAITVGRQAGNTGTAVLLAGSTAEGVYVNGATVNDATTLDIGNATIATSGANFREDSGAVTVGGLTTVTNNASGRISVMDISGGTFTSTNAAGIQVGGGVANGNQIAELLVRGTGVLTAPTITLGALPQTGGADYFEAIGGTTYVGAGGIVAGNATGTTVTVALGNATVATAPVLAATADWSSSLPMALTNSSTAVAPTFQAADAGGTAHNIALSGALSGAGGLNKTGLGVLTLSAPNTYTGATTVNGGALYVNGSVGSNATPAGAVTVAGGSTLGGAGTLTVAGASVAGTLAPGAIAGATTGALTLNTTNGLTLSGTLIIALNSTGGVSSGTVLNTGALTLTGATLTLTGTVDNTTTYDLVNYTGTLGGNGAFANVTVPTGYTLNYAGTTFATSGGFDIELDPAATAVPEPSTWLGGGLLLLGCGWKFNRRRSRAVRA